MTTTSNHDWDIPEVGGDKDVWGQILNDFFEDELDNQIKLEGTFENRPDAGADTVKYYHATDRRIVYYNDGTSWEAVYGLGTDSNPVPGTSHYEALSTEEAVVTNGSVFGVSKGSDTTGSGADLSVTVDDIESHKKLLISCRFGVTSDNEPKIVIDGDDDNGNYYVELNDGTRSGSVDSLTICEGTGRTNHIAAKIELTDSIDDGKTGFRPAVTDAMVSEARTEPRFDNPIAGGGYSNWVDGNVTIELRDIRDGEDGELEVFAQ